MMTYMCIKKMCVHVYDIVVYMIYNYTHVHTAVYYDTLCMHLLIGAIQAIGLVVMEIAVAPLKIKVDILEVEATEVNISVQLFIIATSVARLEYAYLI